MELKAAGIHFQPSGTRFLTDVSFKSHFFNGYLKLPELIIYYFTKSKYLNLIADEMCPDAPATYRVASFGCFLDDLINHANDVKELRYKKIPYNCVTKEKKIENFGRFFDNFSVFDGSGKKIP